MDWYKNIRVEVRNMSEKESENFRIRQILTNN